MVGNDVNIRNVATLEREGEKREININLEKVACSSNIDDVIDSSIEANSLAKDGNTQKDDPEEQVVMKTRESDRVIEDGC